MPILELIVKELTGLAQREPGTSGWLAIGQGRVDRFADAAGGPRGEREGQERPAALGAGIFLASGS